MLVCPHCQFENPNHNKFCQHCGGSLTETVCPHCGEQTPLNLEQCPHCGNMTGTIWRAILSLSSVAEENQIAGNWSGLTRVEGGYLDSQQRYQLLEPLPEPLNGMTEVETNVLDCQPLQPTLLEVLPHQGQAITDSSFTSSSLTKDEMAEPEQPEPEQLATQFPETCPTLIPTVAQPYLTLQDHYPSLPLPQVHDAWEQNGIGIVLLQSRTDLPLLIDICQDENVLPLQILHWLHEMVEHWAALQPHHYGQSLLKIDNLRVDREDYVLCLQRLYPDQLDHPPKLQDLGALWQDLFEQSQRTQNGSVFLLCRDLVAETVTTVEELRSRIEEIASSMQASASVAPTLSSLEGLDTSSVAIAIDAISDEDADSDQKEYSVTQLGVAPADLQTHLVAIEDNAGSESNRSEGSDTSEPDDQPTIVLPMRLISIEDAGRTFTGRQRDHNEDCFYAQTESKKTETKKLEDTQERIVHAKGLYILCDGMGGHAGGEVASALAVETLRTYFESNWHDDKLPEEQSIRRAIQSANQAIYDENQGSARSGSGRMGTTLVLLLLLDAKIAIAHVGDSRLYRFSRRQGLERLTLDHEVGQREIQRGVEPAIAYARPDAYQLTQALGPRDENFINPDIKFLELSEDMLLLLCSDGMTDNDFLELHWQTHLQPVLDGQVELEQGLNQLVEDANQFNGHDNITGVLIKVRVRPNFNQLNPLKVSN